MEIIRFFGYTRSTVYDVVAKYSASEQSNESSSTPARKSRKNTSRGPLEWSKGSKRWFRFKNKETVTKEMYLNVLASVVKPWMETVASGRSYVFQ